MKKTLKDKSQKIWQNLKISPKISKKSQKISKCLWCCFSNVVLRDWVLYCIFFWTIENLKKSQTISNKHKKSQKNQKISKSLKFAGKKNKKQEKNKKKPNKLTQPYSNFAEASGRIAAQLSAVIIFPCVVKCWASMMKGFKTHLLVTWCIAMYFLVTTGRSQSK